MKRKKILFSATVLGICFGSLSLIGCGENKDSSSKESFTYWIGNGESSEYYLTYADNPVMKYISNYKTFENEAGEQSKVTIEYQQPPSGKAADNFNTLITTSSYTDLMDPSYATTSLQELYEDGIILDLGEYIDQYMPNYKKYLEDHPEFAKLVTTNVDGEEKHLCLATISDEINIQSQVFGYCYRRDWIVKYGTQPEQLYDPMTDSEPRSNPNAGANFSGYYSLDTNGNEVHEEKYSDEIDGDSWVDDVVFPSGNTDPIYISDWEWMFEIFEKAIEEENIDGGYCLSQYYPGYNANGDLTSGFGGGSALWYINDDTVEFGAVGDNFKAYLECMNTWYDNGWLDAQFAERSGDVFYRIDETSFRQGKVGLWMSNPSVMGSRLYNEEQIYTDGIVVFGAAQPINDIYGDEEQKLHIPDCLFQGGQVSQNLVVTDKAKDKDLALLFHYLDYFYTEEGALMRTYGLSEAQMEECQDEVYLKYGLDKGAYTIEEVNGVEYVRRVEVLQKNEGNIQTAMGGGRVFGLNMASKETFDFTPTYIHSREQWIKYDATASVISINGRRSKDVIDDYNKIRARIEEEYMYINVPMFIKGEKNFTSDWESFCNDLKKRNYEAVTEGYQEALEGLQ